MSSVPKTPSLASFLETAKTTLNAALKTSPSSSDTLTLVIGNQSADLDSFTSATLYAYFRSQKSGLSIPIINIPAEDIDIRPEFHSLFSHSSIKPSNLCTLTDLSPLDTLASRLPASSTIWLLTDHNKLEGTLGALYSSRVRGVIDHHEDEHAIPEDTGEYPRVVQPCGSCTTLVIQHIKDIWDGLDLSDDESARIAKFALASVLVDTRNLTSVDKTTELDKEIAAYLRGKIEKALGKGKEGFQSESFFAEIKAAKNDISGMNSQGVFRKDYKEWTEGELSIGTSSAVKRLNKLAKKVMKEEGKGKVDEDAWGKAASTFMKDKGCDLWLVLTSFNDDNGVHRRELALHWTRPDLKWVAEDFETIYGKELQLERSKIDGMESQCNSGDGSRQTWLQKNGAWSRKQVAPAIRKVMREKTSGDVSSKV